MYFNLVISNMKGIDENGKEQEIFYTWEDMMMNNANVPNYFTKAVAYNTIRSFQGNGYCMWVDIVMDEDPHNSGVVDDLIVKINKFKQDYDPDVGRLPWEISDEFHFSFGEVQPEELFWMGMTFLEVAKHYGITKESLLKKENKEE